MNSSLTSIRFTWIALLLCVSLCATAIHARDSACNGSICTTERLAHCADSGLDDNQPDIQVKVPDVRGMTYQQAKMTLESLGVKVKAVPSKPGDVVKTQSPAPGTLVAPASVVVFTSFGRPAVSVPDVVGMTRSTAKGKLQAKGFSVQTSGNLKSLVKTQNPPAGAMAPHGSTIHLVLATGIPKEELAPASGDPRAVPKAAPIMTLDYRGGLTPPRKNQDPYFMLYADRTVIVNDPFGPKPRVETKLAVKEVDDLLTFAIKEHGFFRIDTEQLKKAIDKEKHAKKLPIVMDLGSTVIRVRTAERDHEVRCYGLFWYAERLPNLESLQHLRAIEQRLTLVMRRLRGEAPQP